MSTSIWLMFSDARHVSTTAVYTLYINMTGQDKERDDTTQNNYALLSRLLHILESIQPHMTIEQHELAMLARLGLVRFLPSYDDISPSSRTGAIRSGTLGWSPTKTSRPKQQDSDCQCAHRPVIMVPMGNQPSQDFLIHEAFLSSSRQHKTTTA